MKIAVTGNTQGIGKEISDYFLKQGHEIVGFSRTNNYNISSSEARKKILNQLDEFDIFVNNAYNNFDNSQELLLSEIIDYWKNKEKIIINISSRWTDSNNKYCQHKQAIDQLCNQYKNSKVYIINLKPGLTDTKRVKNIQGIKMDPKSIVSIIEFALSNVNNFRVHSITFGK